MRRKKRQKIQSNPFVKFWKIGLIILTIFLAFDLYLLWDTGFLNIKKTEIILNNVNCATEDDIKSHSQIFGSNFFLLKPSEVEQKLQKKFLCVKSVLISSQFPSSAKIQVSGREAAAILSVAKLEATSSSYEASSSALLNFPTPKISASFLVDDQGVIYSDRIENINAPKLYSWSETNLGQKLADNVVRQTITVLSKIKTLNINVIQAKIHPPAILVLDSTPKLIFDLSRDIDIQLASLQLILDKAKIEERELEYVDLRFNKPVIKYTLKKK